MTVAVIIASTQLQDGGDWSSGRTTDSGSVGPGSNPGSPAFPTSGSVRMAHSSSGPGHRPLKAEIRGSNPLCATNNLLTPFCEAKMALHEVDVGVNAKPFANPNS
jgi:hypothetical protein